ncbi:MAG: ATP-binding cassette domain-containing protein [Candidatus Hodgkinia cicadicola]
MFRANEVLSNISLRLIPGELCVLIGKNGVGKSSFANALAADSRYAIRGCASFKGVSLTSGVSSLVLAGLGLFLAFQHPAEIPGVVFIHFVKLAVSKLNYGELAALPLKLSALTLFFGLSTSLLYRPVNVGFSGGERRMLELVQMVALAPKMCILDETDAGLDRVRLRRYVELMLAFGASFRSVLIITHNINVVRELMPDSVYCLNSNGLIDIRRELYCA